MAKKNSCVNIPYVKGQPSQLYKSLLYDHNMKKPLVNYLYASYIANNLADAMDKVQVNNTNKYQRNSQGEHSAADVLDFINFNDMQSEIADIVDAEFRLGATDINGKRVDYTDSKTALEKAERFNNNHKALVAYVVNHGNVYNIIVAEKTADNHFRATDVRQKLKIWEVYKQAFNAVGVNIEALPMEIKDTFNPFNTDLAQSMINLKNMTFNNLTRHEALILFNLDPNSTAVQNLVNNFGSIEEAAQALDNVNKRMAYPNNLIVLLKRVVAHCQTMHNMDFNTLKSMVSQMSQQTVSNDPETNIKKELDNLNKQYGVNKNEIIRINQNIDSLSDAVADAIFVLQRQIRELRNKRGTTQEGKRLEGILQSLMRELSCKRYYSGMLTFLNDAAIQIGEIDNMLLNIPQTGSEMDKIMATVKVLQDIKSIEDRYYTLVSAIADDSLKIDEDISQTDIDNLRQTAKSLKNYFDGKKNVLRRRAEGTMEKLLIQVIGNAAPDGQPIANIVAMAAVDSSLTDFLYSVGRASNPIIAAMGTIIRDAQNARDPIINGFRLRIARATDKLYKNKSNSEFMYEDEGHIISDIDWVKYSKAREAENNRLKAMGLWGYDLKQALEDWEDKNTEDRVVDVKNGRTERVPNAAYRNNKAKWDAVNHRLVFNPGILTAAQQEYYDEMMQIKGEIGSLLPTYAQHHYLPPQCRRSMLDAIAKAKSAKEVLRAIKNKFENLYTVREDDENYYMNGILGKDELGITDSDFDDTPLREIPIFHINPVKQGELLKDFSSGLQTLAGTAINYHLMNSIVDVVEFMGDFVKDKSARDPKAKADMVDGKMVRVVKLLINRGKATNNSALVDGFIAKHIYGQKYNPRDNLKWTKFWNNIIGYTSFKGLSTNFKGAFSNYIVGEFQMMIEAGAGEFYGWRDFAWAHRRLFGGNGVGGELAELLTNNIRHKGVLFRELFDPINENFADKSHQRYYVSAFRQLVSHDCSFIGYASGEYLIHYVNMYAILHREKVELNGKEISLFDAFEMTPRKDGNTELVLKQGVTKNGKPITITGDYIQSIRNRIRYANQTCHGSMNSEDKGLIHQYWWGRGVMNFRQWMVEHYSRRFRKRHFDATLKEYREGYWTSYFNAVRSEETKEAWKAGEYKDAISMFMKDFYTFTFRAQSQWSNLTEMQKYNVKRVHSEMLMFIGLLALSFAIGEPDDHKEEFWRRFFIYQVKRLLLDTEASLPISPRAPSSILTILQSPMAGISTLNSMLYAYYGLMNGDVFKEIQSGPNKGQNKYLRNIKKNVLPFFKDWEQMQRLATDDAVFKIFDDSPGKGF